MQSLPAHNPRYPSSYVRFRSGDVNLHLLYVFSAVIIAYLVALA